MIVEEQITINGSKAAVWAEISNIENGAQTFSGIEKIEIVEKPANGLVGLKWRETRILFGKPATVEKWITDATENQFYKTLARDGGFEFTSTKRLSESSGGTTLTEIHESNPQSLGAKIMSIPMTLMAKGYMKKAIQQDLNDVKTAVEKG